MTREEKVAWLEKASVVDLMRQYDTCMRDRDKAFEIRFRSFEEIQEDYELVKAEVFKRLSK